MEMKQILILEDNDLTRNKLVKILESIEPQVAILPFSTQEDALGFALTHRIDLFYCGQKREMIFLVYNLPKR